MEKTNKLRVFLAYGLFIIVLANMPGQYLPGILTFSPSLNHVMAFFVMGLLLHRAVRTGYAEIGAMLLGVGYLIEWMQLLGGYREFSFIDLFFDIIGITLYIVVTHYYQNRSIFKAKGYSEFSSNPLADALGLETNKVPAHY